MYKLNEEKMFYDYADGQAVVINYQTGMYYGMGLLASAILDRIVAGKDVEEIIKAVKELPQCPPDIAERVHSICLQKWRIFFWLILCMTLICRLAGLS